MTSLLDLHLNGLEHLHSHLSVVSFCLVSFIYQFGDKAEQMSSIQCGKRGILCA